MKLIVGIDFGTSTTVVRYREEGSNEIKSLKADNGKSDIIPTIIFRPKNGGNTVYGTQAEQMSANHVKGDTIVNFKMDLLNPDHDKREEAAFHARNKGFASRRNGCVYQLSCEVEQRYGHVHEECRRGGWVQGRRCHSERYEGTAGCIAEHVARMSAAIEE